ncbi:MFS transporter [Gordonia aquimaris]|uniref:MFS transporter n=1 Tax=Gordonia aquimaris TaxID=2984863 RepID=A0A9X3D764_9ACTN|nr:MFS transporter [Gordonia aquimaris]MCX2966128.1 MFS transporter [Gordonia aquimaris]
MAGTSTRLLPGLVYAALTTAVVSSLGMLLVPSVAEEYDVAVGTAQWMLTINLLVGAVTTPVMGRLSDGPHKKRLLIWALAVILLGSVMAAAAPTFAVFLAGRALQGLSYGIVPVTIALARRYLSDDLVRPGISALSVTVATGLGVGYPLTGVLASGFGFRMAFVAAAIFLVTAMVTVWAVVPSGPDERAPRQRFDVPGAVLLGAGLSAVLLAVSEGPDWGWLSVRTIGAFAVGVAVLVGWGVVELRTPHPMINLRIFRHTDVILANGTAIGLGAALYIGLSIASLIAQAPTDTGYGIALPLLWAGFVMLPLSVGSFGANRVVRLLAARVGLPTLLRVGTATMAVAAFLMLFAHDALWEILIGMFLFGVGLGTAYAAMPALIARTVVTEELGSAVSFNQVLRTVGGAGGSALSGAVLAAHPGLGTFPDNSGIVLALALSAIGCLTVFGALVVHFVVRRVGIEGTL